MENSVWVLERGFRQPNNKYAWSPMVLALFSEFFQETGLGSLCVYPNRASARRAAKHEREMRRLNNDYSVTYRAAKYSSKEESC